jgi:hypothetical protein
MSKTPTVEELLGIGTIELPEFDEAHQAFNKAYPVGEKVILHGLEGAWAVLNSMSGTVWRHSPDPMWSHVIEVDYPVLVPVGEEVLEKNYTPDWALEWSKENKCPIDSAMAEDPWERKVTVHGSMLARLDELQVDQLYQINKGCGLVMKDYVFTFKRWARMWAWIGLHTQQDQDYAELPEDVRNLVESQEDDKKRIR